MIFLLINRVITKQEWQDIIDNFWDNPSLFLTQKEFPLVSKEIKDPISNRTLVSLDGQKYILYTHRDEKDNLMGYILLNFESSFNINKEKGSFCKDCTQDSLNFGDDVPFGELSRSQLEKVLVREETTHCSNCQKIISRDSKNEKTAIIWRSKVKYIK